METAREGGETQHGAVLLSELLHFNKLQSRSFTEHKGPIHVCFEGIVGEEDNHISVLSDVSEQCADKLKMSGEIIGNLTNLVQSHG